jgi:PAS domain-containing protein
MTLPTAAADGDGVLSEGRQRRLFEDSPVAIGLSDGGRVVHGNPAFFRLFGLEAADLQRPVRVTDLIDPASHRAPRARRSGGERLRDDAAPP